MTDAEKQAVMAPVLAWNEFLDDPYNNERTSCIKKLENNTTTFVDLCSVEKQILELYPDKTAIEYYDTYVNEWCSIARHSSFSENFKFDDLTIYRLNIKDTSWEIEGDEIVFLSPPITISYNTQKNKLFIEVPGYTYFKAKEDENICVTMKNAAYALVKNAQIALEK